MSKKGFFSYHLRDYRHATPIQVLFVGIDKPWHVNNATILSYFETARVAYLNDVIGRENDWISRGLILAHPEIDYLQPVYQDDQVIAHTRTIKVGTKSFTVENILMRIDGKKEVICAYATGVLVCMNYNEKQTVEIPTTWKEKLTAFEKLPYHK